LYPVSDLILTHFDKSVFDVSGQACGSEVVVSVGESEDFTVDLSNSFKYFKATYLSFSISTKVILFTSFLFQVRVTFSHFFMFEIISHFSFLTLSLVFTSTSYSFHFNTSSKIGAFFDKSYLSFGISDESVVEVSQDSEFLCDSSCDSAITFSSASGTSSTGASADSYIVSSISSDNNNSSLALILVHLSK